MFLPSKYYMGGVFQISSDEDDPRKLKSKPKKNEYLEHLNKASAKNRFVPKTSQNGKLQTQKKTHFDHPSDLELMWPEYHPPPSRVKIVSSHNVPTNNPNSQGRILPCNSKELEA